MTTQYYHKEPLTTKLIYRALAAGIVTAAQLAQYIKGIK